MHDSLNHTSILDDYSEGCSEATPYSYSTPIRIRELPIRIEDLLQPPTQHRT